MEVYVKGKRIRLNPTHSIGKGGEADVYDVGNNLALKVYKPPSHPDFQGCPEEKQAARFRIDEHQQKLPAFPKSLPSRVVTPQNLATSSNGGKIVGYTMEYLKGFEVLLRYAERRFRQAGISNETVIKIFRDLLKTVDQTHRAGVVIGDFNDLNILVRDAEAYLIDADSFQFDKFFCRLFTEKFVDPILCDPAAKRLMLNKPHNPDSDWYSYAVMLMQCLLFVDPYGGVYRPKDKAKRLPHPARPLHRITVFNPEVRYPKPATHYQVLPDDLLQHFYQVFEKDWRGQFPDKLLENLRWTSCTNCGVEHARGVCPNCAEAAPAIVKEVTTIRGQITATRFFQTPGLVLFATTENGLLRWIYYERGQFKREDGSMIVAGKLNPGMRFRICGNRSMVAQKSLVLTFKPSQDQPERLAVDSYRTLPVFDANERGRYWLNNGQLLRDGQFGPEYMGDVLSGQTLFWIGPQFGFGFYHAANLQVGFVFDARRRGLNDTVKLPKIPGQLIDATCYFCHDRVWFFVAAQEKGITVNRCLVLKADGSVIAQAQAEQGDDTWLGTLRGKCAAGKFLLAATDDGLVRVEPDCGQIVKTREFPDTEPFVDAGCHLFLGKDGIYVVSRREISMLKIR